jgi:hypothetical protein
LPLDIDYDGIAGLSNEVKQRLERARPSALAQVGRPQDGKNAGAGNGAAKHVEQASSSMRTPLGQHPAIIRSYGDDF